MAHLLCKGHAFDVRTGGKNFSGMGVLTYAVVVGASKQPDRANRLGSACDVRIRSINMEIGTAVYEIARHCKCYRHARVEIQQ
ncbi:hypothetical protein [Caenimonas soli]|uniref:hypothetical protein n=1 Tax=Caenimonas soli TaxID=2735555 RepID=UPI00155639B2|nr:hypothetical protein [Caenimonas soli]NPC57810.1 hypothetical protein [Caenimonas soli]